MRPEDAEAKEPKSCVEAPHSGDDAPGSEPAVWDVADPEIGERPPTFPVRSLSSDLADVGRFVGRVVYRGNPFYLVSACLVLYGLHKLFHTSDAETSVWILTGVLAGYTALMAATGALVVRLGKVWEDARSILLIVVLLFLAMAMSVDEVAIKRPEAARATLIAGLGLAMLLSEITLSLCRIRLHLAYRGVYHLFLAVFFLYAIVLRRALDFTTNSDRAPVTWAILAFPWVASLVFLPLVAAIRKGRAWTRDNGTPWSWPLFPWALFALLGLGVVGRTFYLTFTMYPGQKLTTPFEGYMLCPVLLVLATLLFEFARTTGRKAVRAAALLLPLAALALAFPGSPSGQVQVRFQADVLRGVGSPVFLAAVAAALFYAYTWLRGDRLAEIGLALSVVALSVAGPRTINLETLTSPNYAWWVALGGIEMFIALWRRSCFRVTLAGFVAVAAGAFAMRRDFQPDAVAFFTANAALGWLFLIGWVFPTGLGKWLRRFGAAGLCAVFLVALTSPPTFARSLPAAYGLFYCVGMLLLPLLYARLVHDKAFLAVAALNLTFLIGVLGADTYRYATRPERPTGLGPIFWGAVAFVVAAGVSAVKSRALRRRKEQDARTDTD